MLVFVSIAPDVARAQASHTWFYSVPQCRIFDTRAASDGPPFSPGVHRIIQVAGKCGIPAEATAVSLNAAVVDPSSAGYLRLYPPGYATTDTTSSVNVRAGDRRAAAAIRRLVDGQLGATMAIASAHVILDVNGYFVESNAAYPGAAGPLGYEPLPSCRAVDTRETGPILAGSPVTLTVAGRCGVPATAAAANLGAKVYDAGGGHFILVANGNDNVSTSNLNMSPPFTVHANGVVAGLGLPSGDVNARYSLTPGAPAHLALDVDGYFDSGSGAPYWPSEKGCRAFDQTIPGGPIVIDARCGLAGTPEKIRAVAATVTVVSPTAAGVVRAQPLDSPEGSGTVSEFVKFSPAVAAGAIVDTDIDGRFVLDLQMFELSANARVVVDVFGYFGYELNPCPTCAPEDPTTSTAVHANEAKGFDPETPFQVNGVDHVNLFNGNLVVSIPLTKTYSVGPELSYALSLVYNSNPWSFQRKGAASNDPNDPRDLTLAVPNPQMNAGLGWQVTPGALYAPGVRNPDEERWVYVGPDGGEHIFFDTLQAIPTNTDDPGDVRFGTKQKYRYTRDGSFLRLTHGPFPEGAHRLEMPDGNRHWFDASGRLVRMTDRFNNWVAVAYGPSRWTITDSAGGARSILVHLGHLEGAPGSVVAIETRSGAATVAKVELSFETQTVARACPSAFTDPLAEPKPIEKTVAVPLLTAANFYDYTPSGPVFSHWFGMPQYVLNAPLPPSPDTQEVASCKSSGALAQLRLPTGGTISWTYQNYRFPKASMGGMPISLANGVRQRIVSGTEGSPGGTWTYDTCLRSTAGGGCGAVADGRELMNTVTDPLGHKSRHYFSVFAGFDEPGSWNAGEYGLPFTRLQPADANPAGSGPTCTAGCFLSTEVIPAASTDPIRKSYVRYEIDAGPDSGQWESRTSRNARATAERLRYLDDGNRRKDTLSSDWDGLGHYRVVNTYGDFPSGNERTVTTKYNENVSLPFSVNAPWILDTFSFVLAQEPAPDGGSSYEGYTWNQGLVTGVRAHLSGNATALPGDVVLTIGRGANGFPTTETRSGGDVAGVSYTDTHTYQCALLTRTIRNDGVVGVENGVDCARGEIAWSKDSSGLRTDFVYDGFGRLTASKPTSGDGAQLQAAWTSNVYQLPPTVAVASVTTRICPRTAATLGGCTDATQLAKSERTFDGHGRLSQERRWRAGGWDVRKTAYDAAGNVHSESTWGRGAPGTQFTTYKNYDAFGRYTKLTPPDGSHHDVDLAHFGDFLVERRTRVGRRVTAADTILEDEAVRSEAYDRQGRLWRVREPSEDRPLLSGVDPFVARCWEPNSPGAHSATTDPASRSAVLVDCDVDTTYGYDEGGRLVRVETRSDFGSGNPGPGVPPGGIADQTRRFEYDARGFLDWESHPEKVGIVDYQAYDPLGLPRRKVDGGQTLHYTYTAAGRPKRVDEEVGGLRPLVEIIYGTSGSDLDRVDKTYRYNYRTFGNLKIARVLQDYSYDAPRHRVSSRLTGLAFWTAGDPMPPEDEKFVTSFAYDDAGQVQGLAYPVCSFSRCTPVFRNASFGYADGLLTSVGSFASGFSASISYHANGLWSQVTRSNGRHDVLAIANGMARPHQITIKGIPALGMGDINLGPNTYDGAGNLVRIVTDAAAGKRQTFLYDLVGRLVRMTDLDGSPSGLSQSYEMDAFGNVTSIGSNNAFFARSTPTDPATNRLNPALAGYDDRGRQTSWASTPQEWDGLDQLARIDTGAGENWFHVYDADGERFWSFSPGFGGLPRRDRFTIRDLDGRVLREFELSGLANGDWQKPRDYVYRGSLLLATATLTGSEEVVRHTHVDHLGSVRLHTTSAGGAGLNAGSFSTLAFGEQINKENTLRPERLRYTGHERDLGYMDFVDSLNETVDDVDSMHARFYRPRMARFMSVDPVRNIDPQLLPQRWNRYAYVRNSPLILVDPNGLEEQSAWFYLWAGGMAGHATIESIKHAPKWTWVTGSRAAAASAAGTLAPTYAVGGHVIVTFSSAYIATTEIDHGLSKLTGDHLFLEKRLLPGIAHLYEMWYDAGTLTNPNISTTIVSYCEPVCERYEMTWDEVTGNLLYSVTLRGDVYLDRLLRGGRHALSRNPRYMVVTFYSYHPKQ